MADTASLIARVKTEGVAAADKQLDDFAASAAKAETQTEKFTAGAGKANIATRQAANDGFAKFRNAAGQVGFQVQDMVVQLQSGTSAFVAIGQQGSQLAGAFGPGGAVLGAVIALASAVGGVLYKSLGIAGADMEALEKNASELSKSFQIAKDGTLELSDSFVQAANSADGLSQNMVKLLSLQVDQNLNKTTKAIEDQRKAWEGTSVAAQTSITTFNDMTAAGVDVGDAIANIASATPEVQSKLGNLNQFLDDQASKYGVNKQLIIDVLAAEREYANENTPAAYQKVADAKGAVASAATKNKEAALEEAKTAQQLSVDLETLSKQSDVVAAAQNRQGNATNSATTALKNQSTAIVEALEARNKGTIAELQYQAALEKRQFAEKNADDPALIARFNQARDEAYKQDVKAYTDAQNKKSEIADAKAAAAAKRLENEAARQQKAADDFLKQVDRTTGDELSRINAKEQQKLETLNKYNEAGRYSVEQYEKAKTDIQLTAENERQTLLAEQKKKQDDANLKLETFKANLEIQNASELEALDIQQAEKLKRLDEYYKNTKGMEEEYQASKELIAKEFDDKRMESYSSTLSDTTSALKTALGEGNALYKAAAITETVINTYKAATGAYSALAAIPIVGPALGVAAAAAAVGAGMANVAKIRSAREQGGTLAAGQASTIAERNKPEVIMPASASRVRTAEQMRQIMGENGGKSSPTSITIVNQTTGRIDDVQQQQDDEERITILIREVVSGDLQDSNSKISQSRRVTRNQPGFS